MLRRVIKRIKKWWYSHERFKVELSADEPMCSNRAAFADGQLKKEAAAAFRRHLATCEECQEDLLWDMQVLADFSVLFEESNDPGVDVDIDVDVDLEVDVSEFADGGMTNNDGGTCE